MNENYESLLHRWFEEVWNQGRKKVIYELFAEDGIAHGLTDENGNELRGTGMFVIFHKNFRSAFPDIKITVEETIIESDKIAVLCFVSGTHTGDELGFKATNKPTSFTGQTPVKVKDGNIVEAWNHFDFMPMFRQIEVLSFKQ
jgi:steroid delta-isomerase-like uncharacterized protein